MIGRRPAFTLLEMLVTLTVLAFAVAAVVPMFEDEERSRLRAAVNLVTSDIELAQVANITRPGAPLVLRFDPGSSSYWLAAAEGPSTPVPAPGESDPYLVTLGAGRARAALGVSLAVEDMPEMLLAFTPQGSLSDFGASPAVVLTCGPHEARVRVTPSTGTLRQE